MALKSNFNESQSMKDVQRQAELLYDKIRDSFIMAGEKFIINAREQGQSHALGQYGDITANLRNSITYYLYHNGELVIDKEPGAEGGKKTEGKLSASEIKLINDSEIRDFINPKGFQLIAIAGMNYASHVESKGYNVISYQGDILMVDLTESLEKLDVIEQGSSVSLEETFVP